MIFGFLADPSLYGYWVALSTATDRYYKEIGMLFRCLGFVTSLGTMIFAWLLAVWSVGMGISQVSIVLDKPEPFLFTDGPTAPGVCPSQRPSEPSTPQKRHILQSSTWKVVWVPADRLAMSSAHFNSSLWEGVAALRGRQKKRQTNMSNL